VADHWRCLGFLDAEDVWGGHQTEGDQDDDEKGEGSGIALHAASLRLGHIIVRLD
jgi:hypothetical protein